MSFMCRPKWPLLHMYGSHDMRHVDFRGLTGSQRTPGFWSVTAFKMISVHALRKFFEIVEWLHKNFFESALRFIFVRCT